MVKDKWTKNLFIVCFKFKTYALQKRHQTKSILNIVKFQYQYYNKYKVIKLISKHLFSTNFKLEIFLFYLQII